MSQKNLQGIYAISDTELTPNASLQTMLKQAIQGGITLFQLRDKTTPKQELSLLCQKLAKICASHNIPFILNDHISLAISLQTQGLHVGKDENDKPYSPQQLRHIRAQFRGILGVSCYGDLELAHNAIEAGADYIAFGSCFASQTKPQAKTIDLEIFKHTRAFTEIPLCAIGGINQQNISKLKDATMIACVRSIWSGDIVKNVQQLLRAWKS